MAPISWNINTLRPDLVVTCHSNSVPSRWVTSFEAYVAQSRAGAGVLIVWKLTVHTLAVDTVVTHGHGGNRAGTFNLNHHRASRERAKLSILSSAHAGKSASKCTIKTRLLCLPRM